VDRLANYTYIFILIFLFILEGRSDDHIRILIALFLSFIISMYAFLVNWITLDGAFAATVFGTVALGLGGWILAGLVLVFFVSSSLITRHKDQSGNKTSMGIFTEGTKERRNGLQIWANGFWIALFAVIWFLFRDETLLVMASAALAAATADTWATELGSRKKGHTILITNFRKVDPGTDGAISLKGTLAGFWGALLIAFAFFIFNRDTNMEIISIVAFSGFLGCIADSYLGAIYQHNNPDSNHWFNRYFHSHDSGNNAVNWAATGLGALFALFLIQLT